MEKPFRPTATVSPTNKEWAGMEKQAVDALDDMLGYTQPENPGKDPYKLAPEEHYTFQGLYGRHTFATNLLKAGKSLAFVKDAGHWSSGKLVMETYGHLERSDILESSAEVGEKWGNFQNKARK